MSRLDDAVDSRLREIREVVRSGATEMTGRVQLIDEGGGVKYAKRYGGGMSIMYPEIGRTRYAPGQWAAAVERGKGKIYRTIRTATRDELSKTISEPRRRRPEKPTVPPHDSLTKKCKTCGVPHGKSGHRFHGKGALARTHLFSFGSNPKGCCVKKNAGEGRKFLFHGSFTSLLAARRKESTVKNGFIIKRGNRYQVLSSYARRNPVSNKSQLTKIYGKVLRIEAQKTGAHHCDAECRKCGHRYFHDFKVKPSMYGLPDGTLWIK